MISELNSVSAVYFSEMAYTQQSLSAFLYV